jgi:hypothetical protein
MYSQLARIRSKLKERRGTLNPVAPELEVLAFEARHGISLPADYRLFLTELGNGGMGPPDHGLVPLGHTDSGVIVEEKALWSQLPFVARPFPFTRYWVWEDGEVSEEGTAEQVGHGSVYLGHDGCGMLWHLIVSGAERGVPWQLCGEGIQPVCPKRSFLQWYEDWLDGLDSFYGFPESGA